MSFEIAHIALIGVAYIATLFFVAFATSKGWLPARWVRHPLVYVLSLGVSMSAWTFYGIVDLAWQYGYGVLAYYLGTGAMFLFAPVALEPLARLAQRYQLTSPADLLVFRYHSRGAGTLATLFMLLALLPLIALQIQAVAETLALLSRDSMAALTENSVSSKNLIAFFYCVLLAVFTSMYGATSERRAGLSSAMALESLVKLVALLAVGGYAIYGVFGGFGGLDQWLGQNPDMQQLLYTPIKQGSSHTLLLVFIATAVAMPHIFYLSVAERSATRTLRHASWGFPLFLLLMALPIFPIMWAGFALDVAEPVQYFALAVPRASGSPLLTTLAFIGGLSAATGALVMMTLALSTMVMNHWLLPGTRWHSEDNMYRQLVWLRRALVVALFLAGFGFYLLLDNRLSLSELALLAFIASLQFLPGIFAVIHWPSGNRRGFIGGLLAGMSVWALGLLIPSVLGLSGIALPGTDIQIPLGMSIWTRVTTLSLAVNVLLFVGLSLLTRSSSLEQYAADLCSDETLSQALRLELDVQSAAEFRLRLSDSLGDATANQEVNRALRQLRLPDDERRPYALRQLRDKLEANLSGLLGRVLAGQIIDRHFPFKDSDQPANKDIHRIETRLSRYKNQLTGLAAELNNLRLYHRQMLEELPLAACSLGRDGEILLWNYAMQDLTGIAASEVLGSKLDYLAAPWRALLIEFAASADASRFKQQVDLDGDSHWLNLHKTRLQSGRADRERAERGDAQMLLLEDITETQVLERELMHSERLASVGRLAAGVAHEVGNPVTGIACLAQNLQYESDSDDVRDTADQIVSQTQRISRIVHSLVNFSHSGSQETERAPVDLYACVQEAVQLLSLQRDKTRVTFENAVPEDLFAPGDNQRLIQVFINLLSNARDASPDGGHIQIDGYVARGCACVAVADDGPGISAKHRERILEPFFTTKEPGKGTGLGLAMVYSIVEEHDGQLELISPAHPETGRGAKFVVQLPIGMMNDE
ncbi:ATP-binding protein [Microbulbifer halophilus]|uniref:histidine kinase n=1 Tax=Microbulbifer halophilus TaxID=453963 RepID=A0ABW5EGB9_9GAMM|nr:ATP-binding protein [Microbulbifer halophilus]MCW8126970.1 ATP-binding protein [Microbulbifer halophilus]